MYSKSNANYSEIYNNIQSLILNLFIFRNWVFHEVNIEKKDLEISQSHIIADLVYPRRTILDESLGTALWYAACGMGHTVSPCRVSLFFLDV